MIYVVKIDFTEYEFESGPTALNFMELAKRAATKDITIGMTVKVKE